MSTDAEGPARRWITPNRLRALYKSGCWVWLTGDDRRLTVDITWLRPLVNRGQMLSAIIIRPTTAACVSIRRLQWTSDGQILSSKTKIHLEMPICDICPLQFLLCGLARLEIRLYQKWFTPYLFVYDVFWWLFNAPAKFNVDIDWQSVIYTHIIFFTFFSLLRKP